MEQMRVTYYALSAEMFLIFNTILFYQLHILHSLQSQSGEGLCVQYSLLILRIGFFQFSLCHEPINHPFQPCPIFGGSIVANNYIIIDWSFQSSQD